MIAESENSRRSEFLEEVISDTPGGERIVHCLQCGSIFAMISANQREEVLTSNTMWCCVSCYFCTTRCPQDIPITEIMYALKRLSIKEGMARDTDAPALAKTFTDLVDKYGRSFEFGLASRYYFFNKPLSMFKLVPMGLSMLARGRMHLKPNKIRQVDQLQAIINKAKEIGKQSKQNGGAQ